MSQVIPISQTNATSQTNTYVYNFPSGSQTFRSRQVALANLIIPYSWYNLSTFYGNTTGVSMIFPTGATTQTVSFTIPDGFYTIDQLNAYLQSEMIAAGFYLVDGSGDNVYYLQIEANVDTGLAQLNCYIVPTSLPVGWTNPGSWTLPTTANQVPQLVIANSAFGDVIGFVNGNYPSNPTQVSTYSVQSSYTPQISPVSSIYLTISLVNNELSSPNNIISVVPITSTFGAQIIFNPSEFIWVKCLDGTVNSVTLILLDQNLRAIPMTDTAITANILIK